MQTHHRSLRTFCTAAEHLSFKKAANELCLTPSAVSHQISELEEQLGTKLFRRLTRSVSLTNEGSILFEQIDSHLKAIDRATEDIRRATAQQPLLMQMPEFFASELLMPKVSAFSEAYPEIDLHLEGLGVNDAPNPAADISMVLSRKTPNGFKTTRLFPVRYVPACSGRLHAAWQDKSIDGLEAIKKSTLLLHKARPQAWEHWAESAGVGDISPRKIIYVDSMFALSRAAEKSVGIALMPLPVSQGWFDTGSLVALHEFQLVTQDYYWLILNAHCNKKPALVFWRWLIDTFQQPE